MKDNNSNNKPKMQWWQITALSVGIVLIVAATAYSLITKANAASNGPLGKGNVPSVGSNTGKSASAGVGIGELNWVKNLNKEFADRDFIFVILQGSDDATKQVADQVALAATKIQVKGARVGTLTLSATDPEFSSTTQYFAISQLPAVLGLSKNGNGAIVSGTITETKLLEAYMVASQPICPPGSSSGCCPPK